MNIFRMIAVLIVTSIVIWLQFGHNASPYSAEKMDSYSEAIDSAHNAVGEMGGVSSRMISVYEGISVPDDSTVLDVSNKELTGSLKAEIRQLVNLRELDLSINQFTGVPAEVGQLSKLEILNLSYNPITGLPLELGKLANLKVLDLRGTNYSTQDLSIIKESLTHTEILID